MRDLVQTVATCFEQVAFFYEGGDPKKQESFNNRADYLDGRSYKREELADILEKYHQHLGAGPKTMEQISSLRRPDCLAVVTGQQAGFLTGPSYTLYKALTVIRLADEQSEKLRRPVVPIFWVASEDHDWAEVKETMILNQEGKPSCCTLPGEGHGLAVGRLAVPAWSEIVGQLEEALPASEFRIEILERLRIFTDQAANLTEWFVLILQWLVQERGLIFFDPLLPEIKYLNAPMYEAILRSHDEVRQAFNRRTSQWENSGQVAQIRQTGNEVNLFWEIPERRAVLWDGTQLYLRGSNETFELEAVSAAIRRAPGEFSSNVVTRPIIQEYLFPTLAYVPGPGELNYWAQLGEVFTVLGLAMPILFPRLSVVLISTSWHKVMNSEYITLANVRMGLDRQREQCVHKHDQYAIEDRFTKVRAQLDLAYQELLGLEGLDTHVPNWIEQNREKVDGQVAYLEKKIWQAQRKRCDSMLKKLQQLEDGLMPCGEKQERVLNPLSFLVRYGWGIIDKVAELPLTFEEQELIIES